MMRALLLTLMLIFASAASAQIRNDAPLQFNSAAEEQRFHDLATQLRCVMCQNQSLADSNAQIAIELRREVLTLMRKDMTDAQIKDYLVARYGEFVLYKPPFKASNMLLWAFPLLAVLGALVALIAWQRKHKPVERKRAAAETDQRDVEW